MPASCELSFLPLKSLELMKSSLNFAKIIPIDFGRFSIDTFRNCPTFTFYLADAHDYKKDNARQN